MGTKHSSLQDAVIHGRIKRVQKLLNTEDTYDINNIHDGKTLLFHAVSANNEDMIEILLQHGADPNILCTIERGEGNLFKWTALHEAAKLGNVQLLEALINHSGNVDNVAHIQMTPLHIAAWHGHREVVQKLVDTGCDVNKLDRFQESALVIPICHGDVKVVELLLHAGCKLNSRAWGNLRKLRGKYDTEFQSNLAGRQGPLSLFTLATNYCWLNIAVVLLQHGYFANRYPIYDVVKDIKQITGTVDALGKHLLECYISAGYRFWGNDYWLLGQLLLPPNRNYPEEVVTWLQDCVFKCPSLKETCRKVIRDQIRKHCSYRSILKKVETLPLPPAILSFLSMQEFSSRTTELELDQPDIGGRDPLYFAAPRRRRNENQHVYVQFWRATCCCFRNY